MHEKSTWHSKKIKGQLVNDLVKYYLQKVLQMKLQYKNQIVELQDKQNWRNH